MKFDVKETLHYVIPLYKSLFINRVIGIDIYCMFNCATLFVNMLVYKMCYCFC